MKRTLLTTLALAGGLTFAAAAAEIPDFVGKGLDAYKAYGVKEALRLWEVEPGRSPVYKIDTAALGALREALGPVIDYEYITTQWAGESYVAVYVLLRMEKGPVFLRLGCYRDRSLWRVMDLEAQRRPWDFVPGFSADRIEVETPEVEDSEKE